MSTISLSKLRKLPYHERWKLISTCPNWTFEARRLIEDFPDWEHEEIEKKAAKDGFVRANAFIKYDCINAYRLCSMLMENVHKEIREFGSYISFYPQEYRDIIELLIPSLTRLSLNDINKKAINVVTKTLVQCYSEEMNALSLAIESKKYMPPLRAGNAIIALINSSLARDYLIDFNMIANAMLENLNDSTTIKIIIKMKSRITDPKLLEDINDQIAIYDIIT